MKILFFTLIIFFTSCGLKKNFNYFQGQNTNSNLKNHTTKIKSGDAIGIKVFGSDQQSLDLFNIPGSQILNQSISGYNTTSALNSYLVNNEGDIDFPMIGKLKVLNLTLEQVSELIKSKIKNYITDPKVIVQILNFKISVIGDVAHPNTFFISTDKISIIEAIALAGDLNITAKRNNIKLVRFENGNYKEYIIDLTKKDFFNSDFFYLQQNDILYIEPNQTKINSSKVSSSWSIAITVASLIITTLNLISR